MIVIDKDDDDQCVPGAAREPDDDGDVDDHYDEDDQCLCQGLPGEPDGKLPSQKWCQLARSQNLYDKDNDYSHQFCCIHFENCECQIGYISHFQN